MSHIEGGPQGAWQAHGMSTAPRNLARPPGVPTGLATAGLVLGGLYTLAEVLTFLASFEAAETYAAAARTGTDVMDVLTTYDLLSVAFLLLVPLWIVSSLFLQRSRTRAVALWPGRTHRRGPAWTWLAWIVPVVCLWYPYQVVRDIVRNAWRDPWAEQHESLFLGAWWALWLASLVSERLSARLLPWSGVPDADQVAMLPFFHGITAVTTVIGFVLWVRIVRSVVAGLRTMEV